MVDKVRVGIIGYGFMGSTHAKMLVKTGLAEVVAIADIDREKRVKAEKDFPHALILDNPDEIIERNDVDAVVIATLPDTHIPLLVKAIKTHKHVLVEKPLAPSLEYLAKLMDLEIPDDIVVMTGYSLRYHPMYIDLHNYTRMLGVNYFFHHTALGDLPPAEWILDPDITGGMINENAVHILYLFYWYYGLPDKVYGRIYSKTKPGIEDNALIISWHGETTATLLRSWTAGQIVRYFQVIGEKGSISIEGYLGGKMSIVVNGEKTVKEYPKILYEMYEAEDRDFIESIIKGRKPRVTLRDGVVIQMIVHALKQSNKLGEPVDPVKTCGQLCEKLLDKL